MARNEEGEFELMLGNKQLLSVFFLMVVLLCICFVGGYLLGRSSAPVLKSANEPLPAETKAIVATTTPKGEPVQTAVTASAPAPVPESVPAASSSAPPTRTAPQVSDKSPEPTPVKETPPAVKPVAKTPPAKSTPPPTKQVAAKQVPATKEVAAKSAPASGQPVPGRIYLQLSATDKDKAEVMVDLLHRKNLPGMASAIAERPGLFRVLVGPLAEGALADMKAKLQANGFPGDQAIRRVF